MARIQVQIIDDDHWCAEAIIAHVYGEVRDASFEIKAVPEPDDGRDVYVVDNEFEDGDHGLKLVRWIRERNPESTIIMCTGTHDRIDPIAAMNTGCNAMIVKGTEEGRDEIRRIFQRIGEQGGRDDSPSFLRAVRDIQAIITMWNKRVDQEMRMAI